MLVFAHGPPEFQVRRKQSVTKQSEILDTNVSAAIVGGWAVTDYIGLEGD